VSKINRCLHPDPRFNGTVGGDQGHELWLLFEQVPQKLYLPAFQQRHELRYKLGDVAPCECSCPYFTSTKLPCCAMCALFARKGIVTVAQMCPFLHSMWLVKNHPLFEIATKPAAAMESPQLFVVSQTSDPQLAASAAIESAVVVSQQFQNASIQRQNADALRNLMIPTDNPGRRNFLSTLFQQVLPGAAASAVVTREIVECLLRQRAALANSQSLLAAPASAISRRAELSRQGPICEIQNLAAFQPRSRAYNPSCKGRVATARRKDPSCYGVHKQAGLGLPVTCLCGVEYNNEKRV
jgi:hypothetical protein